jgi:hydroxymethylpyrimidine pyrophosphatase-like HAD family hydrolase
MGGHADMGAKIIAVDFDGTLCKNTFPYIGEELPGIIGDLKSLQANGVKLILWTCRRDELLQAAIAWCEKRGLVFDAVNENTEENIKEFCGSTRKVFAHYYLDDRNATIEQILNKAPEYTKQDIDEFVGGLGFENVVIFENPDYSSAFVGVTTDGIAVYDYELMIQHLIEKEQMNEEDASDFIGYNTVRSLPYTENSPIIINKIT